MAIELSYVLITPYSLMKSRTGGILARLLSRTDLDFAGAQVLTFSKEQAEVYAQLLEGSEGKNAPQVAKLLADYVRENFPSNPNEPKERVMMLLFRGEDACRKLTEVTGRLSHKSPRSFQTGETIRDTYADMVEERDNPENIRYFEPAVFTPPTLEAAEKKLKFFGEVARNSANIIENSAGSSCDDERTLVIIKPDNWRHPSSRPGNIIDMLSRTGLRIIGCKVYRMSVAEALEFYGPVQDALRSKLAPSIGKKALALLEKEFGIPLQEECVDALTGTIGISFADDQFGKLVEFMSGRLPSCTEAELNAPGLVKCLILVYEGKDAINKIRSVLGPTDPGKAPGGTVRRDFGSDIMVNTAHASDSADSARREMKIVKINENPLSDKIAEYIKENKL